MEQRRIWSHFQQHREDTFSQAVSRHRFLLSQVRNGRILNIGVGDGGFERLAMAAGREVFTVDPDDVTLAKIGDKSLSHCAAGMVQALPFEDASFEAVVCSEVFEHLSSEVLIVGLAEIWRVLKPGGELHGTVPAEENLAGSEIVCPNCGIVFHRWGHVQSFTRERLEGFFRDMGTIKIQRRSFVHWPSLNWKGKVVALLRRVLQTVGCSTNNDNFYFCIKKNA